MELKDAVWSLLRQSFGIDAPACLELTPEQWEALPELARGQAVSGWIYDAVSHLGGGTEVPSSVLKALEEDALSIRSRAQRHVAAAAVYVDELRALGLHPVVMKGPAVARYYPRPELRVSGDLDIYLPEEQMPQAVEYFRGKGCTVYDIPDGSLYCTGGPIDVDLHTSYYDLHVPASQLPPVPSAEARLLMLSAHILKHAAGPGVGMRQICDMAITLRSTSYDRDALLQAFAASHTLSWNRMLCSLIKERLGVDAGLFERGSSFAPLERIILSGGNFGHFRPGRQKALASEGQFRRKLDTAWRILCKLPFALRYAPREYFSYTASLIRGNLH